MMAEEFNLQINLGDLNKEAEKELKKQERVKAVKEKKKKARYIPTWDEVWFAEKGVNGATKNGILKSKITDLDKSRLIDVKRAIENGEIGIMVENLSKFSKAHALNVYKQLFEQRREKIIADMIAHAPLNYHLITDRKEFLHMINLLGAESIIGLDTETNGLDYDKNHIVGISITLPVADYHCYIPVRHENEGIEQLAPEYVFNSLKPYLENEGLKKVLHNAKFDMHMFWREGIYLFGVVMDTIIAMKVLNENEPSYALKNLATKYGKHFGFEDKSMTYVELFGKGGFERTPLDIGTVYACKDTHLCYEFYLWIMKQFDRLPKLKKIFFEIEAPLLYVSFDMERAGFEVDLTFAEQYTQELSKEVDQLSEQLKFIFGDINMNSQQQLAEVIYDKMGLDDVSKKRSVDADTIKLLADEDDRLKVLLGYREKYKLLHTYFEALPNKVWGRDNRLHGSFNQNGTKTGRYSSNDPNLQNIPPTARPMFIAPAGKVIIGKDLSQIEPRCLAFMSGDKDFQEPYIKKTDLYSTLASKVFHKPIEECGDGTKYRKMMKTGLLAVMYGTSNYTFSKQLGITVEEAEEFITDFLSKYPTAKEYMQAIRDMVDSMEYVETFNGRKRRFIGHKEIARKYHAVCGKIIAICGKLPSNIWTEKKIDRRTKQQYWEVAKQYGRVARQSVNFVIQGSSADYIKQVMIRVNDYLKTLGEDYRLIATIHDEILMEVPDTISPEIIAELDHIMTGIEWFEFPIKTDTVVMYAWGNEIPVNQWMENREEYNRKRVA